LKKLLLLLLLSFGFIYSTHANERVNLSCAFYESYNWQLGKSRLFTHDESSLIVLPSVGKYIYDGIEGYYKTKGNEILFTHKRGNDEDILGIRYDYSLDRTTGVFELLSSDRSGDELFKWLTHKGKCTVSENLF
jgi:hypothetical protein